MSTRSKKIIPFPVASIPVHKRIKKALPLDQWFDLSKPIRSDDREGAEAQMVLYAYKDGLNPDGPEIRKACAQLRAAVKAHNTKF